jgi:hypothetical protein
LTLLLVDKTSSNAIPTFDTYHEFPILEPNVNLSILHTRKQLHTSGTSFFLTRNIFNLEAHISPTDLSPFWSISRGISPMNVKGAQSITHLEVKVEELDLGRVSPIKYDRCFKLNETVKYYPEHYMSGEMGNVQWIQCVLDEGREVRSFIERHLIDLVEASGGVHGCAEEEGATGETRCEPCERRVLDDMLKQAARRKALDFFIKWHALRIVASLPFYCKVFSRILMARQDGAGQPSTHSIVLLRADGEETRAAERMARSRGIYVYARIEVDVEAGVVKVVEGKRKGDYLG